MQVPTHKTDIQIDSVESAYPSSALLPTLRRLSIGVFVPILVILAGGLKGSNLDLAPDWLRAIHSPLLWLFDVVGVAATMLFAAVGILDYTYMRQRGVVDLEKISLGAFIPASVIFVLVIIQVRSLQDWLIETVSLILVAWIFGAVTLSLIRNGRHE